MKCTLMEPMHLYSILRMFLEYGIYAVGMGTAIYGDDGGRTAARRGAQITSHCEKVRDSHTRTTKTGKRRSRRSLSAGGG